MCSQHYAATLRMPEISRFFGIVIKLTGAIYYAN